MDRAAFHRDLAISEMQRVRDEMRKMLTEVEEQYNRALIEPTIAYRAKRMQDTVLWRVWNAKLADAVQSASSAEWIASEEAKEVGA